MGSSIFHLRNSKQGGGGEKWICDPGNTFVEEEKNSVLMNGRKKALKGNWNVDWISRSAGRGCEPHRHSPCWLGFISLLSLLFLLCWLKIEVALSGYWLLNPDQSVPGRERGEFFREVFLLGDLLNCLEIRQVKRGRDGNLMKRNSPEASEWEGKNKLFTRFVTSCVTRTLSQWREVNLKSDKHH